MDLCSTFIRLALETWDRISQCRNIKYQIKEETITDLILMELKLKHHNQIVIKEFNKYQESKNGADWEWWFQGKKNEWVGFRVQAKVLNINSNKFEHLFYKSKNHQYQTLINNSQHGNYKLFPIYCLYLHTSNQKIKDNLFFYKYVHIPQMFGCSILSAYRVNDLAINKENDLESISKYLSPWHLLVCRYKPDNDLIENIKRFITGSSYGRGKNENEIIPDEFVTKSPPDYVIRILKEENIKKNEVKELRGVVIINEPSE